MSASMLKRFDFCLLKWNKTKPHFYNQDQGFVDSFFSDSKVIAVTCPLDQRSMRHAIFSDGIFPFRIGDSVCLDTLNSFAASIMRILRNLIKSFKLMAAILPYRKILRQVHFYIYSK